MADLEDSFTKLLGRAPSDAERQDLYRVKDALGIKPNDALWVILMALGYHQTMYEAMPAKITKTANEALAGVKAAVDAKISEADARIKASAAATKQDLAAAVIASATTMASNVSARQKWQWAAGCFIAICLAVGGLGFFMYYTGGKAGHDLGYAEGYQAAADEKATAAWANTPQGRMAYRAAQLGTLDIMRSCNRGPEWQIINGNCYPKPDSKGSIAGWRIP